MMLGASTTARDGAGRMSWECVDLHCGGEPARILMGGAPDVKGKNMAEKRQYFMENLDYIRQTLLLEPRGYPCQNLNIIVQPTIPGADAGYIIAEQNKIYPLFSGHNTICTVTALLETGRHKMIEPVTSLTLEAPGGLINIKAECTNGRVEAVRMTSMLSFVEKLGCIVYVPAVGQVTVDISFGGMWYVVVDLLQLGLDLKPENGRKLAKLGEMIKVACREQFPVQHPAIDYPGPDILVFTTKVSRDGNVVTGKNTVVMSNGELIWDNPDTHTAMLDRSPCGSGTAAVMAVLFAKGELVEGDVFKHHGILGLVMEGRIVELVKMADGRTGIVPEISGRAYITSMSTQILEQDDPLPNGFTVSDIWC